MKNQRFLVTILFLYWSLFFINSSYAFSGYNKARVTENGMELSMYLNLNSKIEYELNILDIEVERQFLGFGLANSIGENIDAFITLNYIYGGDVELTDQLDYDGGYFTQIGTKMKVIENEKLSFFLYGQINYLISDEFSYSDTENSAEVENSGFELSLGGIGRFPINEQFSFFAGLELIPLSEIDADITATEEYYGRKRTTKTSDDYDRDSIINFKLGGEYQVEKFSTSSELSIGNEQSFSFCLNLTF